MNTFDGQRNKFRDEKMESLLRDFFAEEMPVEVCELADQPVVHRAPRMVSSEKYPASRIPARVARAVGISAAIAAVLLLAWGVGPVEQANRPADLVERGSWPESESETASDIPVTSQVAASAPLTAEKKTKVFAQISVPSHAVPYAQTEDVASLGLRKYATRQGPVEQRTHVRTTNVSFYEPQSGSQVRLQVPEIEIEILMTAKDEGT